MIPVFESERRPREFAPAEIGHGRHVTQWRQLASLCCRSLLS
jgi:hypothetical protein